MVIRLLGPAAAMVIQLALSGAALAAYPETCLGPNVPSAADCGSLDYYGCCDASGRVVYCQGGELYCIDCPALSPSCGWSSGKGYNCGQEPLPDPSWAHPMGCSLCDPPCAEGKSCVGFECIDCTPDCQGKDCGPDGCGGWCGDCGAGEWCGVTGTCEQVATCPAGEVLKCGDTVEGQAGEGVNTHTTYPCTKYEFPAPEPAYKFTAETDTQIILELAPEAGKLLYMMVSKGACAAEACFVSGVEYLSFPVSEGVEYFILLEQDPGPPIPYSLTLKCQSECVPDCDGRECGDDGCFSTCGDCAEQFGCVEGMCELNDGCWGWRLPGCNGCKCQECVCEKDSWCCDMDWDELCANRCLTECGGCFPPDYCGDGKCNDADEDCTSCSADCTCEPPGVCLHGSCCMPDCEGKLCGDDGCGGSCGDCEPDASEPDPEPVHVEEIFDCGGGSLESVEPVTVAPEQALGKNSGGCNAGHSEAGAVPAAFVLFSLFCVAIIRRGAISLRPDPGK